MLFTYEVYSGIPCNYSESLDIFIVYTTLLKVS